MTALASDLRYAARALWRSRAFSVAAVLCLALGIGANTAVFSMINTLVLRPLPVAGGDRVLMLYASHAGQGIGMSAVSWPEVRDVRAASRTLEAVAALRAASFSLAGPGGEAERVRGAAVSHDLFPMLGERPLLGRGILPEEDRPGAGRVVVLSHALWERRFGARPEVLGSRVLLGGLPYTVVGVMRPRFGFPENEQLWVPLRPEPDAPRGERSLQVVARLREGATPEQAGRELAAIAARAAAREPDAAGWSLHARRWRDASLNGSFRFGLWLMLGAVGFVLLIACANVANLQLARGAARRREIAVRLALGAGRGRIVRLLLAEAVLIALPAGALGALLAVWLTDWILARTPVQPPYWVTFGVDARVLAFTAGLSLLTAAAFGMAPALRASRPDVQEALKDGGRGVGAGVERGRLRSALVAGQVAASLVLLVGATLMVRSFLASLRADLGFDTRPLLTLSTSLTGERYDPVAARAAFFLQAEERVAALPGVRAAALTTALPGDEGGIRATVEAEGRPAPAPGREMGARRIAITPGLFETVDRPLLAGRAFTAAEAADSAAAVAIVNEALARALWPGGDAVGRRLRMDGAGGEWLTVVGVAPTLPYHALGAESASAGRQVYVPYAREGWRLMTLLVRAEADPTAAAAPVRSALAAMDATLPVFGVRTMDEYRAYTHWDRRMMGEVFGVFALAAVVLAAIGVYGVMAYAVSQRRHEIGVRMALGARAGDVLRLVVGQGAALAGAGIALGLVGALGVARVMRSLLYGVGPVDPVAFLLVPLVLAGVALLAAYLPARRAARVDPVVALRVE